jgi:DNA-binding transcriptional LysR family regulator
MDYRKLDLNLLVVLDALLEERGVHATARRLHMSQPNVSFALGKLRHFFHDELLVRIGNAMHPTPMGDRLREPVRRILETVDAELLGLPVFDPLGSERCFSISTSDIGELVFLPTLLKVLKDRAPRTTLRCHSMPPHELERAMADGMVDIALGYFPDLQGSSFLCQTLFDHPFSCIVRRDHPGIGDRLSLDQFLGLGHILVSQKGRSQELVETRMQQLGLSRRIQLQSPHFMSVPLLVAGSDLISTVPHAVGAIFATMAPLKLLAPPFETPLINLQQFWHRRVHGDPAIVWFRTLIAELFLGRDPSMPKEGAKAQ